MNLDKSDSNLFCSRCFRSLYGHLPELFQILHEGEGDLASACSGGFISLSDLSTGIGCKNLILGIDFLYKLFHDF